MGFPFFPWEGVKEGGCFYLVWWEVVMRPVEFGELGIDNLRLCYRAVLAIWLWCFPLELNILWHKIIWAWLLNGSPLGVWEAHSETLEKPSFFMVIFLLLILFIALLGMDQTIVFSSSKGENQLDKLTPKTNLSILVS